MADYSKSVVESVNAQPYSCCTDTKATTYKHTWEINNYHVSKKSGLQSSEYSSGGDEKFKWYWQIAKKNFLTLQLELVVTFPKTGINFISNVKGIINGTKTIRFNRIETGSKIQTKNCLTFCLSNEVKSIMFDIELTIIEYEPEASMPIVQDSNLSNLGPILPGVLAANWEESPAHKAVLANPVFRAMLSHEAIESTQNKVTIADIEPKVLEQLLRFIYTDSLADLDMAFELLQAADKYDLEKLKTRCEAALCGQISEETAVHTLFLADLYRADQLKRAAVNFIGRNVGVIQTEDWKKLMLKNFELANGVMIELLEGTQLK